VQDTDVNEGRVDNMSSNDERPEIEGEDENPRYEENIGEMMRADHSMAIGENTTLWTGFNFCRLEYYTAINLSRCPNARPSLTDAAMRSASRCHFLYCPLSIFLSILDAISAKFIYALWQISRDKNYRKRSERFGKTLHQRRTAVTPGHFSHFSAVRQQLHVAKAKPGSANAGVHRASGRSIHVPQPARVRLLFIT
jgi:hypothetical protein